MAMPPGYRLDVHEGHAFAVAPDEAAGDFAVDDSGEDAAHVVLLLGLLIMPYRGLYWRLLCLG